MVVAGLVALASLAVGAVILLQHQTGQRAVAVTEARVDTVAEYDAALEPLRRRSDVLERRFARAQSGGPAGPERVHDVLEETVRAYAGLLDEARAIEVRHRPLVRAHRALLDSLERQQEGLETALRGLAEDDAVLMARAGRKMVRAQELQALHRRLLARARD